MKLGKPRMYNYMGPKDINNALEHHQSQFTIPPLNVTQ